MNRAQPGGSNRRPGGLPPELAARSGDDLQSFPADEGMLEPRELPVFTWKGDRGVLACPTREEGDLPLVSTSGLIGGFENDAVAKELAVGRVALDGSAVGGSVGPPNSIPNKDALGSGPGAGGAVKGEIGGFQLAEPGQSLPAAESTIWPKKPYRGVLG